MKRYFWNATVNEEENNELLLTVEKRDKEVHRENGWFKLHRQAGLLIWRLSLFVLWPNAPTELDLLGWHWPTNSQNTHTYKPPRKRGCLAVMRTHAGTTYSKHTAQPCKRAERPLIFCGSGSQCDLNPHLSVLLDPPPPPPLVSSIPTISHTIKS